MKTTIALAFAAGLLTAGPAAADKLDFSKLKCGDFLSMDKDNIGLTLVWMEGFYTKEDAAPVLDTDKLTADAKSLAEYCAANKDKDIISAAESVVKLQ